MAYKGFVYILGHATLDDGHFYIGSSLQTEQERLWQHQSAARTDPHRPVLQYMADVGPDNVDLTILEEVEFDDVDELRIREQYWIDELQPDLNIISAYNKDRFLLTDEQRADPAEQKRALDRLYYLRNKEAICEYQKRYNEENREKVAAYHKTYRERDPEAHKQRKHESYLRNRESTLAKNKVYRDAHADEMKAYFKRHYEQNKEQLLQQQRKYYEENREVILAKGKERRRAA